LDTMVASHARALPELGPLSRKLAARNSIDDNTAAELREISLGT
jgi:hypothetical protein